MEQETEAPQVPTEKLVKAFIKMRDARAALTAKYEAEDKAIKEQMEMIEHMLMDVCKKAGADSIRTGAGTVIRNVKTSYWTSDWESMHNFIKENQALELLERRIAQRAMKDWLEANPDKMPKGLNTESKYTVTIRRS
jgi:phage host-nuclease inhibitor protein Gam